MESAKLPSYVEKYNVKVTQPARALMNINRDHWRYIQRGPRTGTPMCSCGEITGTHKAGAVAVSGKRCEQISESE